MVHCLTHVLVPWARLDSKVTLIKRKMISSTLQHSPVEVGIYHWGWGRTVWGPRQTQSCSAVRSSEAWGNTSRSEQDMLVIHKCNLLIPSPPSALRGPVSAFVPPVQNSETIQMGWEMKFSRVTDNALSTQLGKGTCASLGWQQERSRKQHCEKDKGFVLLSLEICLRTTCLRAVDSMARGRGGLSEGEPWRSSPEA